MRAQTTRERVDEGMPHHVYVLLSEGREWTPLAGTTSQAPAPARWYLRQSMPEAVTQTVVFVDGDAAEHERGLTQVIARAGELGGIVIDGPTQQVLTLEQLRDQSPA